MSIGVPVKIDISIIFLAANLSFGCSSLIHIRLLAYGGIAPIRLYDLRHTWATRAAMAGIDLATLAAMLGHSKINMVLRYAHPTQDHQATAMAMLERYSALEQIRAFERQGTRPRAEDAGGTHKTPHTQQSGLLKAPLSN